MAQPDMRAAIVRAPGKVELVRVACPDPAAGEVRIRLQGCGVCASNLEPWAGSPWTTYPLAPGALGHEGWGIVDAVGAGVRSVQVGERVAMLSQNAYAEYDVAPADALVRLPDELGDHPFPGEAAGCAFNIYRRAGIRSGATVAIVGIGFLGAILTRLASLDGARVIAISRRPETLALARTLGAAHAVPMHDHGAIVETVRDITGGALCDVAIEAVGKQWPLDLAAEVTREHGRLIIAGYHQDGPRQINMQLWNWRGFDVINAHERKRAVAVQGMREAADAAAAGRIDVARLCTHTFPLERLDAALNATRDKPPGFVKAYVRF